MKLSVVIIMVCLTASHAVGQTFTLQHVNDSLSLLMLGRPSSLGSGNLGVGGGRDVWRLPYPTYAFATGDVDSDGVTDALVGVIKPTRYDPRMARRLFVFRNVHGRVRPLWLGSRLTGELRDFRLEGSKVITLEQDADSTWFVGCYSWESFGFVMTASRLRHATQEQATQIFQHPIN